MRRLREEAGFTLIEVLIVTVILTVLAAIALAMFTTQKDKGHDADAKSNAAGLAAAMKACYIETSDYNDCDGSGANDKLGLTGLPLGSGAGQVSVNVSSEPGSVIVPFSVASPFSLIEALVTPTDESSGAALRTVMSVVVDVDPVSSSVTVTVIV